ncbi:MAG: ATP-binding protein [Byssovorax sp.]
MARLHKEMSHDLKLFLKAVGLMLIEDLGEERDAGPKLLGLINVALDRRLGIETTTGSIAMDLELDRIRCKSADFNQTKWFFRDWTQAWTVEKYALEIGAISCAREHPITTGIGNLILTLPHRDTLRWLLAVEVTQAQGPNDDWRISRSSITALLAVPEWTRLMGDEEAGPLPASWVTLDRLAKLGLVSLHDTRRGTAEFMLLPEGRPLLEEIAADKDTPFTLLARALLQDQTAATLAELPGIGALMQNEGAAAVATRHARMVAHEIRNSLVPVQGALSGLYEEIERRGQADALVTRRDRIDAGIDRIFRFVREVAQVADLSAKPAELFDLAAAVESAIASIAPELGRSIPFEQEAALSPVKGHRDRFVLALLNLLRNAAQSRGEEPVEIRITAGLKNGAEVFVRIDDDGPGVPPDDRSRIFEADFSRRSGGSGQGLAFVREVVESEMAGRMLCEESPLGGARFVVRLPVGTKRTA